MHGYLKPLTTVSNVETALQSAEHAINDWLAVANDPKGADGKPIQYSESNLKVLVEVRADKRGVAFAKAKEAGFDSAAFEQRYASNEFAAEIAAALAFRNAFNASKKQSVVRA